MEHQVGWMALRQTVVHVPEAQGEVVVVEKVGRLQSMDCVDGCYCRIASGAKGHCRTALPNSEASSLEKRC